MSQTLFDEFFQAEARLFLLTTLRVALSEDGADLTSQALFTDQDTAQAQVVAKQEAVMAGLPILPLLLEFSGGGPDSEFGPPPCECFLNVEDGERVSPGAVVAVLQGPAARLLTLERTMLNTLTHLSGVATLTAEYVKRLQGTRTRLLDTRKTLPGLRYPEKYAVLVGGGTNHRKNLSEMLMLKDNHIDRAGSIPAAVDALRAAYDPCPPIEVECRNLDEVRQAVGAGVDRVMLDNMDQATMRQALELARGVETEISGGVDLDTIADLARLGPDFISVGRLTHSAPAVDLSMRMVSP